jgi:hypothetical protein
VTQPLEGAKHEGAAGFIKGVGRGLTGMVVKPAAGIYALPGYAMKGIYKEIQKQFGASVNNYIIAARTAQGWEAWLETDKEFQTEIIHRYLRVYEEAKKKKGVGEDQYDAVTEFLDKKKERRRERWAKAMGAYKGKKKELVDGIHSHCPANCPIKSHKHSQSHSTSDLLAATSTRGDSITSMHGAVDRVMHPASSMSHLEHASTFPQSGSREGEAQDNHDLEEAIRLSVQESSTGDTEEDRAIQRAIRASIAELHRPGAPETTVDEDEETQLRLAIQESMIHDNMKKASGGSGDPDVLFIAGNHDTDGHTEGEDTPPAIPPMSPMRRRNKGTPATTSTEDDDEDLMKAIEESKKLHTSAPTDVDGDDLEKAMADSKRLDEEAAKAKHEEEVVLEYIKKQSLAEEEHRKRVAQGRDTRGEGSGTSGPSI